jgi:hypothetical protein
MKPAGGKALVFGGTAAAVLGATVVARVVCPGGCQTCEACVASVAPVGTGALVVAGAMVASVLSKRKSRRGERREQEGGPGPVG